jgi:hypothetical protein
MIGADRLAHSNNRSILAAEFGPMAAIELHSMSGVSEIQPRMQGFQ